MQEYDWNDLKYLLALHRAGTLSEAGRKSSVSETTVARRVRRLEHSLGICLFIRNDAGKYQLTEPGQLILDHAGVVERENVALLDRIGQVSDRIAGTVRVSSVLMIIQRILLPGLAELKSRHPHLIVELVPEARNIDLTKRDADLAVRFSRPAQGGLAIKAQKFAELEFAVFCASCIPPDEEESQDWIGYDDASASLPQATWTEALRRQSCGRLSNLRVSDLESALEAAANGYGKSLLPKIACEGDNRFRLIDMPATSTTMTRDVWLLSHNDHALRVSVKAVKDWLINLSW